MRRKFTLKKKFPRKIYTVKEFTAARQALAEGHKHHLRVIGGSEFKTNVKEILSLIKKVGYYDFLRTYIRKISEVDGVSQLRETEASIWLNNYVVANPCEGARFIIQKSEQMKRYLEGKLYYIAGERPALRKSLEFLEKLSDCIEDKCLRAKCEELLKQWTDDRVL